MTGTDIALPVLVGERVLVVEDGEDAAAAFTAMLRLNGLNAGTARTAAAALEAAAIDLPRVVLLDLGLPDDDGHEVVRKLRELPDPPEVVVVTGLTDPAVRRAAFAAGAAEFLLKPAEPTALVALVVRLCNQPVFASR